MFQESWECDADVQVASAAGPQVGTFFFLSEIKQWALAG